MIDSVSKLFEEESLPERLDESRTGLGESIEGLAREWEENSGGPSIQISWGTLSGPSIQISSFWRSIDDES